MEKEKKPKKENVEKEETKNDVEEFFEEKGKKEVSVTGQTISIFLWIILFGWMAICIVDYVLTRRLETDPENHRKPIFVIKSIIEHDDGVVEQFTGLGYRVHFYNRDCFKGVTFGPFWAKDASVIEEACNKE